MAKIIIDVHEKNSLVVSELAGQKAEIEFRALPVGDYIIGDNVIERKTTGDFISSMINGRLVKQVESLMQFKSRMLLVEGMEKQQFYDDNAKSGVHANSIRGMLLSIMLKSEIPILFTKDYEDTAKFLLLIAKRCENDNKDKCITAKRKASSVQEQIRMILECFPGIGSATAKKLLKKFGTINAIINSNSEELESTIRKKVEIIKALVNRKY